MVPDRPEPFARRGLVGNSQPISTRGNSRAPSLSLVLVPSGAGSRGRVRPRGLRLSSDYLPRSFPSRKKATRQRTVPMEKKKGVLPRSGKEERADARAEMGIRGKKRSRCFGRGILPAPRESLITARSANTVWKFIDVKRTARKLVIYRRLGDYGERIYRRNARKVPLARENKLARPSGNDRNRGEKEWWTRRTKSTQRWRRRQL